MKYTEHQRKILKLLKAGASYAAIGETLKIAPRGIQSAVGRVVKRNRLSGIPELRRLILHVDLSPSERRYAGVTPTKSGKWKADISIGKRGRKHLGTWATEEEAIAARVSAEEQYRRKEK